MQNFKNRKMEKHQIWKLKKIKLFMLLTICKKRSFWKKIILVKQKFFIKKIFQLKLLHKKLEKLKNGQTKKWKTSKFTFFVKNVQEKTTLLDTIIFAKQLVFEKNNLNENFTWKNFKNWKMEK